jgi:hypothetical protein
MAQCSPTETDGDTKVPLLAIFPLHLQYRGHLMSQGDSGSEPSSQQLTNLTAMPVGWQQVRVDCRTKGLAIHLSLGLHTSAGDFAGKCQAEREGTVPQVMKGGPLTTSWMQVLVHQQALGSVERTGNQDSQWRRDSGGLGPRQPGSQTLHCASRAV